MEPLTVLSAAAGIALGDKLARVLSQRKKPKLENYTSHWWLIGRTGHFKSTYIREEIAVPFKKEFPKGSLVMFETKDEEGVKDLINALPLEQLSKTLLFSPADMIRRKRWIGLNLLERKGIEGENTILTDELIACLERVFGDSVKSNSTDILQNGAQAVLDVMDKASILEVYKMFNDRLGTPEDTKKGFKGDFTKKHSPNEFRDSIVRRINNQFLKNYFSTNFIYPTMATMNIYNPIYNKLRSITNNEYSSRILCQIEGINIERMVNEGWNIIFFFPKGLLGTRTSRLLSSIAFSKVQLAMQARVSMSKLDREERPVLIVADEFQDYCINNSSFSELITQVRSLGGGLVLSHQHVRQEGISESVIRSIVGNVGNVVCGRVGPEDSGLISNIMRGRDGSMTYTADILENLDKLVVVEKKTRSGKPLTPVMRKIGRFEFITPLAYAMVREASLDKFGIPQEEVDLDVSTRLQQGEILENIPKAVE